MTFPLMGIYLAARYSRRDEIRGRAGELEALGYRVRSKWYEDAPATSDGDLMAGDEADRLFVHGRRMAAIEQLKASDLFIEFTDESSSSGGRHFEAGYITALGLERWIVGPLENIFQTAEEFRRFPDWPAAKAALADVSALLTPAQLEVWALHVDGLTNAEIGAKLNLKPRTVRARLERANWAGAELPAGTERKRNR